MQIQLKQTEIKKALEQYIANQGINLSGKSVDIQFTAGRKESGLTADIVIQDAPSVIPAGPIPRAAAPVTETVEAGEPVAEPVTATPAPSLFGN